ncbi:hypothetical protein BH09BAC6_BH09BAC6_00640 [soil metagenome]
MVKRYFPVLLCFFAFTSAAQTPNPPPAAQAYGKIDKADLEMKSCEFEPDANAEVLFDKADIYFDPDFNIIMEFHRRVKIFNNNGKKWADIRLEYDGGNRNEYISDIQAESINLVDGKIEVTKVDKKLIYVQHIDRVRDAAVFSLPNVKEGSVIEYKYRWSTPSYANFPNWYFQDKIPVRYSELSTSIPDIFYYRTQTRTKDPYINHSLSYSAQSIGTGMRARSYNIQNELRALANIHSLPDEPFMSSDADNLQCILFNLTTILNRSFADTWPKIGGILADDRDFGEQLKRRLPGEDTIIAKASALKTDDEKISYLFNVVKGGMKWNESDRWYTDVGTVKAWENKTGNSAEINIILTHLLNKSGVKAYPMVVSTRKNGKVNPYYPSLYQFNKTVAYIPVNGAKYILDATSKYNIFNEIPPTLLNSSGLCIDKEKNRFDIVFLKKDKPVKEVVLINAEIKPGGKMTGTAQVNSFSYIRINSVRKYKSDGETKYIDDLSNNDNNLKISAVKFQNMEIDTLPLIQNIDFSLDLTGSDENYIFFKPNLFTSVYTNPFLAENRFTDVDFGYLSNYTINGIYTMPAGYKIDAMPKNVTMSMADSSISFKRVVGEQGGVTFVRYLIDFKKTIYLKEGYPEFHEFYKKMHEMLSEQIVLKKS